MARISQTQMAKLFNRLATSYTAGIDLRTAYQRETETGSPSYRINAKQVYKGLKDGRPLADSMALADGYFPCLLYTSPSPRDKRQSRMPSSA